MQAAGDINALDDPLAAAAILDPLRRRLLSELQQPDSAAGLARRIGLPRQKINYHLRELENAGLVIEVERRVKGNCVERVLRATARSYVIAPGVLGDLGPDADQLRDQFSSAYLVAAASRAIDDLAWLRRKADEAGMTLATLTLETEIRFANPAARRAFTVELAQLMAALAAKYHDASAQDGRGFRLLAAAWPQTPKDRHSIPKEQSP